MCRSRVLVLAESSFKAYVQPRDPSMLLKSFNNRWVSSFTQKHCYEDPAATKKVLVLKKG